MTSLLRPVARGLASSLLIIATLLLAACASDDRPAGKRGAHVEPLPTLSGRQDFFGGQITAEVKVGAMTGFSREGDGSAEGGKEGRHGRHGGGGGFGGGMGMGGGRPPRGEGGPGESEGGPRPATMRRAGPSGPPVMIHLRFTNHGSAPVELRIADFLSPLGNFVVSPEKLTLAPGASAEVEPMTSGLAGQVAGGEITLKLQVGDQRETKTVPLQVEAPPSPGTGKSGQSL